MNPDPFPDTSPPTDTPTPNPDPDATPAPTEPTDNSTNFWSPWPLPPQGNQLAFRNHGLNRATNTANNSRSSGWSDATEPGLHIRSQQQMTDATSAPSGNLKYRGGRTIRDLYYVNLYVSGDSEWSTDDVERIDGSLSAAMSDEHLNNVLLQYFNNQTIRSTALPSHPLVGYTPKTVTRGDIQNFITYLHTQGFLHSFDLRNTIFNLMLPPGTVLTAESQAANSVRDDIRSLDSGRSDILPAPEDGDSLSGLGGYHGSVVTSDGGRVYYAVGVYPERFANGQMNGIPVFDNPWKNVVATFYHQLIEARTNPDVEDALRESSDLDENGYLGWVSDSGHEIGDIPLQQGISLTSVITEVPLADGSGTVPIQLPYSNYAEGPEGPIAQPHPLPIR